MRLTIAAKAFRDRASALLNDAGEAMRAVGDDVGRYEYQRARIVTVAAVPTATLNILPRAIRLFTSSQPNARVRVNDLSANDVSEAVASGDADFGISFIGVQEPGLEFRGLRDDEFVLAVNRQDPMASRPEIHWDQIDESRFIAVWKGSGNRMLIDQALARTNKPLGWFCEVRHLSTALGFVEAGLGVTAVPASALPARDHPLLTAVPLVDPTVSRVLGTVRRQGARISPAAEFFHQLILEQWSEKPAG